MKQRTLWAKSPPKVSFSQHRWLHQLWWWESWRPPASLSLGISRLCSYWSSSYITLLSLAKSFVVMKKPGYTSLSSSYQGRCWCQRRSHRYSILGNSPDPDRQLCTWNWQKEKDRLTTVIPDLTSWICRVESNSLWELFRPEFCLREWFI